VNWIDLQQGRPLKWTQPNTLKMNYELKAGDYVISTLRFRSIFGSLATGENADGCWTFKRVGFFQTRATIRTCGYEAEIAAFKNDTWSGGGTLELQGGRKLLATTNLWQTKMDFQDESGHSLIRFKTEGILQLSNVVTVEPSALRVPETSWLVIFGWYLVVMMQMDSAAAAAGEALPLSSAHQDISMQHFLRDTD
jgi:hypothetical protein